MIYRSITLIVILSLFAGCTNAPSPEPLRLRVLTYNIKHARGEDNTFNYQRLADVITSTKPELVALQEVDVKTGRSSSVDQAAKLGELTGMHHHFAEAMPFNGGSYGEAVLYNKPIAPKAASKIALTADQEQEPRSIAVILTELGGLPRVVFGGTHLCHQSNETRLSQVDQINQAMAEDTDHPTILAGDFNFTSDSNEYKAMIDAGWVDTAAAFGDPKPTYPADKPTMQIDYVFVRPAERWRVIDVQVLDEPIASDHRPVLVELEYVQP